MTELHIDPSGKKWERVTVGIPRTRTIYPGERLVCEKMVRPGDRWVLERPVVEEEVWVRRLDVHRILSDRHVVLWAEAGRRVDALEVRRLPRSETGGGDGA